MNTGHFRAKTYAAHQLIHILSDDYILPTRCVPSDVVPELVEYFGDCLEFVKIGDEMCYRIEWGDDE